MLKQSEVVWWKEGEDFHVGYLLRYETQVITKYGGARSSDSIPRGDATAVLVRHSRTVTETEPLVESFVPWNRLYHYYGDKALNQTEHHVSYLRISDQIFKQRGVVLDEQSGEALSFDGFFRKAP